MLAPGLHLGAAIKLMRQTDARISPKDSSGAGYGIGFVSVLVIATIIWEKNRWAVLDLFEPTLIRLEDAPNSGLIIDIHQQRPDTDFYTVVGSVKNNSKLNWKEINIQIDLKNEGLVIDRCQDVADCGWLAPGEEAYFKVKCTDTRTKGNSYTYEPSISFALGRSKNGT